MPDISKGDLKKFLVAIVISGSVESTDVAAVEEMINYALEVFDFIERLQVTMKILEGND